MNMKEMTREQISALADGDLPEEQVDVLLAVLRRDEEKADWDIYHQIGDLLRSDDMAVNLSPRFAARLSASLEAEPVVVAPGTLASRKDSLDLVSRSNSIATPTIGSNARRWAVPSMAAAAAMATVAFFTAPQLMVAMKANKDSSEVSAKEISGVEQAVAAASVPEGVVLRDPRIDDYLMAHQRISPSVYSSTQLARSANFTTDSNK